MARSGSRVKVRGRVASENEGDRSTRSTSVPAVLKGAGFWCKVQLQGVGFRGEGSGAGALCLPFTVGVWASFAMPPP